MALLDNRPDTDRLKRLLAGLDAAELDTNAGVLDDLLTASIADIELKGRTAFNARARLEHRDGDGTAFLQPFRWPVQRVRDMRVETPILGYTRVYQPDEIKVYTYQGQVQIFTYKMVADVVGVRMDLGRWGVILPPIPQSVHITYCYGFPQYDPDAGQTTYDGGATFEPGDTREPEDTLYVTQLAQAAVSDAAASYLAQVAGQQVGLVSAVSFDGFSKTLNPAAYGAQVQALIAKRDELLERRTRPFLSVVGTYG